MKQVEFADPRQIDQREALLITVIACEFSQCGQVLS